MRSGIRFAAVGAGVGLCTGIAVGVYHIRKGKKPGEKMATLKNVPPQDVPSPTKQVKLKKKDLISRYPFINADADFATEVYELLQYRYVAPQNFDNMLENSEKLLKLYATILKTVEAKLSWPSMAQRYTTKAVDALRTFRKKIEEKNSTLLLEVDEVLKRIQKCMTDRNFNINMETNSKLDR